MPLMPLPTKPRFLLACSSFPRLTSRISDASGSIFWDQRQRQGVPPLKWPLRLFFELDLLALAHYLLLRVSCLQEARNCRSFTAEPVRESFFSHERIIP